jgi:hypothetical protein
MILHTRFSNIYYMNYPTKYFTPSLLALFQNDFIDIEQPAYIFVENSIFSDNKINYEGGVVLLGPS